MLSLSRLLDLRHVAAALLLAAAVAFPTTATASTPSATAMARLLESGRVPEGRRIDIAVRIVQRGDADDLGRVLNLITGDAVDDTARIAILDAMAYATKTRKVTPQGDLSSFGKLLASDNEAVRQAAVPLTGLWNITSATDDLKAFIASGQGDQKAREAALDALVKLDRSSAKDAVLAMTDASQPIAVRRRGLARLAELDVKAAAKTAAELLATTQANENPLPMIEPFLQRRGGPEALAVSLASISLSEEQAKNALSKMSAIGSSDPAITAALLRAGNIKGDGRKWDPEKIADVAATVAASGDPVHGEEIFRREALNCFKCHQVNKAGGNIGPELSAVGVTSPNDYLIRALIYPSKEIKEAWATRMVRTEDGQIISGIVVSEDDDLLKLKDAQGRILEIPVDDIDAEKEGDSLMPEGLTKFLTDKEFIDLVAYLKALGTPNTPYAVRSTPRFQRYEVFTGRGIGESIIAGDKLEKLHRRTGWVSAYAKANGDLPLNELKAQTGGRPVQYVRSDVEVSEQTAVQFQLPAGRDGLIIFVNGKLMESTAVPAAELRPGRNRITIRIDTDEREGDALNVELTPQNGGSVRTVDGV